MKDDGDNQVKECDDLYANSNTAIASETKNGVLPDSHLVNAVNFRSGRKAKAAPKQHADFCRPETQDFPARFAETAGTGTE